MNLTYRTMLALLSVGLAVGSIAFAHLMVAQQGTLNLSGDGAYLAVSVATSSFNGVDDNGDGLLSAEELSLHGPNIAEQIKAGFLLSDSSGPRPIKDLKLILSPADNQKGQPADQLIVMGRYALEDTEDTSEPLSFRANGWGESASAKSLSLAVTRDIAKGFSARKNRSSQLVQRSVEML